MAQFEFTVMAFGLCGVPAMFQRLMDEVLRGADVHAIALLSSVSPGKHTCST